MDKRKTGVLKKSLAVYLSIIEPLCGKLEAEAVMNIIRDPNFDATLFSKKVPYL